MSAGLFQHSTDSRSTCPKCDSPLQPLQLSVHPLGPEPEPQDSAGDLHWGSSKLFADAGKVPVRMCPCCGRIAW
jgi:hypothetical protein